MTQNPILRFDIIYGRCSRCEGPLYFTRVIDWEGNRVNTLHCWNGHYEKIDIDHYPPTHGSPLTQAQIREILPFINFVRLDPEKPKE